jgi:hypothetical protein
LIRWGRLSDINSEDPVELADGEISGGEAHMTIDDRGNKSFGATLTNKDGVTVQFEKSKDQTRVGASAVTKDGTTLGVEKSKNNTTLWVEKNPPQKR